jgi:hypothetical protein
MPLELLPTKTYSTASIGKAYLDAMGIRPPGLRPKQSIGLSAEAVNGAAMQAYFGGRTECRIRRVPVPVTYLDFLSQYPTGNALMGLWDYLTADALDAIDATDEVTGFLDSVSLDDLFRPETWKRLPALVQIVPQGDVVPVRGRWNLTEQSWQIGVNPLTCSDPLWFTLADVIASKMLTKRVPAVARAIRFVPRGRQKLRAVKLRGAIEINPLQQDFFRVVIEERNRVRARMKSATSAAWVELNRLQVFLKILANSASYGILAEMNQLEEPGECTVWLGDSDPFRCAVPHPEALGRFCCPPLAALITGAGRLMLAMLERSVADLGGSYAMCDTDSMAIVSSEHGGLVACPGGQHRTEDGCDAVRALSWPQVDAIVQRFAVLNPYDRAAVPGSILKVEDENYDLRGMAGHDRDEHGHPKQCVCTQERRRLHCFAISAKRYSLFNLDAHGEPDLRKWSEHGLGQLLNPTDPDSEDRDWIRQVWDGLVREGLGLPFDRPAWEGTLAASRVTVSSWDLYQRFGALALKGGYAGRIKPGNFLLIAHADTYSSGGVDRPVPVAPYESDPRKWLRLPWLDRKTGKRLPVTTDDRDLGQGVVRLRTYGEVLDEYRVHPESKSVAPDGKVCGPETVGLLKRRPTISASISIVGKETNRLEEVLTGEEDDYDEVYAEYERPGAYLETLRRILSPMPRGAVAAEVGVSRQRLSDILDGRAAPHTSTVTALERIARRRLLDDMAVLHSYERGAGLLPLPALAGLHAAALQGARGELSSALHTLRAHEGAARVAAICELPLTTFERRLASIDPI